MLKMMSDFKTDILANVQESVVQMYMVLDTMRKQIVVMKALSREQILLAKLSISLMNSTKLVILNRSPLSSLLGKKQGHLLTKF